jgi:hypothetical protein
MAGRPHIAPLAAVCESAYVKGIMCTVVVLRRPGHDWPLIVAANRDEMAGRPSAPPARHWPDRPEVVGGLDRLAGGTWFGLNDHGVVAGVLNRHDSLGPKPGYRSRGELPLEALDHAEASAAAEALSAIEGASYRSFNAVIADRRDAYWLRSAGAGQGLESAVEVMELPVGLSMITAHDLNDKRSRRTRLYLPRFSTAQPPDPGNGDWRAWQTLLASRLHDAEVGPEGAMSVVTDGGFGTVSSSLIALPRAVSEGEAPRWLFADGRPGEVPYEAVIA